MQKDRNNHIAASLITFFVALIGFLLLWFLGLSRPYPPPPDYGMEVLLGYSDEGMGDIPSDMPEESLSPKPSASSDEDILTQDIEETASISSNKTPKKKQPILKPEITAERTKPENSKEEIKINPQALYQARKLNAESGAGTSSSEGSQGSPDGSPSGQNGGIGSGAGSGISFSLTGRVLKSLAKPTYESDEQGVVVVKIWVNRAGQVSRTQVGVQGTTSLDEGLWMQAKRAAMNSHFLPDENAPEEQVGTITYKFIRSK